MCQPQYAFSFFRSSYAYSTEFGAKIGRFYLVYKLFYKNIYFLYKKKVKEENLVCLFLSCLCRGRFVLGSFLLRWESVPPPLIASNPQRISNGVIRGSQESHKRVTRESQRTQNELPRRCLLASLPPEVVKIFLIRLLPIRMGERMSSLHPTMN